MAPIGYVAARDLGDGHVEPWEQTRDGRIPLWADAAACRADLDRLGGTSWRVFALVDQNGDV